ncbi:MFS transporter [Streptomyces sp. NPDC127084]|uniref:MFS transporter n=1 Tax=Streptomyces sp. NPDC127084 TaxID=3347133 RepID=UPI0036630187
MEPGSPPTTGLREGAPSAAPAGPGAASGSALARAGRLLRDPVTVTMAAAALLHLLWFLFVANSGGDIAAQDAWAGFAERHPGSAYNFAWYGGMHPMSYTVVSSYLMAAAGVRTTMMVTGTLCAGLLAFVLTRCGAVRRPLPPALWGAVALVCNTASGRGTFGLGLLFALAAVAVLFSRRDGDDGGDPMWRRGPRGVAVVLLSLLATAASPVAGLFLGVVGAALLLRGRRAAACAVALPPVVVVGTSALLFPFEGTQPLAFGTVVQPFLYTVAVLVTAPRRWRTVRVGAAVYAVGIAVAWLVPSQVGSNVERLALLFGGTVLLAALGERRADDRPAGGRSPRVPRLLVAGLALAGLIGWTANKTVSDIRLTTPDSAWATGLAPLVERLRSGDAVQGRVEVVPQRSHREASALAPYVNLARGWNRQADMKRNALFYDGTLSAPGYRAWLDRWAVRYVVLPKGGRPDVGAEEEAALVSAGLPYLTEVWSDADWRLYRVTDPAPLAGPSASVIRAGESGTVLTVRTAGQVRLRIPWSPWLALVDADGRRLAGPARRDGCLAEADGWTRLTAPKPGVYRIAAPYGLSRGTPCQG